MPARLRSRPLRIIGGGASCVLMAALEEIRAGRVYVCARPDRGSEQEHQPPDPVPARHRYGATDRLHLDIATDGALINLDGRHSDLIGGVGPLTRAAFLEIDAIPDIRVECQHPIGACSPATRRDYPGPDWSRSAVRLGWARFFRGSRRQGNSFSCLSG
ncbi:hypothetical protein BQ8482_440018 [Mesorhizobium delmotii]|uniref:Uncharacterized protein n=1 Tax=Mesorhizobium delmotii TaxID=1631247 RepID=A0A2P9ATH5_9HYPH|nr:hypothetical protein BQ8482_440018 [Mesorhizobium delmotii]